MNPKKTISVLLTASAGLSVAAAVLYIYSKDGYLLLPCFFASACTAYCSHYAPDKKTAVKYIITACVIYTVGILLSTVFRRDMGFLLTSGKKTEYLKTHIHLKPFEQIKYYCKHIYSSEFFHCFTGLFGNLAVFVPFSLFLPKIFKKANTRLGFFVMMLGFILFVELGEALLMTGFFETDDILLNLGGAWVAYELLQNETTRDAVDVKLHLR